MKNLCGLIYITIFKINKNKNQYNIYDFSIKIENNPVEK